MLHFLLPMPVPASVYGMALLFFCLCLHVVKEEQIAETAEWLLAVMPVMFIGPGVGIIDHYTSISDSIVRSVYAAGFCLQRFLSWELPGYRPGGDGVEGKTEEGNDEQCIHRFGNFGFFEPGYFSRESGSSTDLSSASTC